MGDFLGVLIEGLGLHSVSICQQVRVAVLFGDLPEMLGLSQLVVSLPLEVRQLFLLLVIWRLTRGGAVFMERVILGLVLRVAIGHLLPADRAAMLMAAVDVLAAGRRSAAGALATAASLASSGHQRRGQTHDQDKRDDRDGKLKTHRCFQFVTRFPG